MKNYFKKGDIVKIEGDIEFDDYEVRVCTNGVVIDNQVEDEQQILVAVDEIDGDRNVNVYVDTDVIRLVSN